ncbi:MAG TPA: TlyA family RNA methyltransferase [Caulobacter sp.]|nr:TlyA family RNA methyltransferase [Caulobacter sp.]
MRRRIDLLLVERGLFDSRAKARAAIEAGGVSVAGRAVSKPGELVDEMAEIGAIAAHDFVGRGALKLNHALDLWPVSVEGGAVLDVGASTGGFTEVCLKRGAARVYAVDVGRGQLHPRIAADPRVVELSGVDARALDTGRIPTPPDMVVCDVSFISLTKALPAALALARSGADLIALVKPQFEAGRAAVGKGGIVADPAVRQACLDTVCAWLEETGWSVQARADSPIAGGDGNREFLVWARKA